MEDNETFDNTNIAALFSLNSSVRLIIITFRLLLNNIFVVKNRLMQCIKYNIGITIHP